MKILINLMKMAIVVMVAFVVVIIAEVVYFHNETEVVTRVTGMNKVFDESTIQEVNYIFVHNIKKSVSEDRYNKTDINDTITVIESTGSIIGFVEIIKIK